MTNSTLYPTDLLHDSEHYLSDTEQRACKSLRYWQNALRVADDADVVGEDHGVLRTHTEVLLRLDGHLTVSRHETENEAVDAYLLTQALLENL